MTIELSKENMEKALNFVLAKDRLEVSVGAEEEGTAAFEKALGDFVKALPEKSVRGEKLVIKAEDKEEAFSYPSQVQYVGMFGDFKKAGLPYTGALLALKSILSNEYLWTEVRLKGGAYGVMCGFSRNGAAYFISYRDPNLLKTVDVYKNATEYVKNLPEDKDFTDRYIITAIGDLDVPLTPSLRATMAYGEYKGQVTKETLQQIRDELLATTPAKIRELSSYLEAVSENPVYCTVGGATKLETEGGIFKTIVPLIKG